MGQSASSYPDSDSDSAAAAPKYPFCSFESLGCIDPREYEIYEEEAKPEYRSVFETGITRNARVSRRENSFSRGVAQAASTATTSSKTLSATVVIPAAALYKGDRSQSGVPIEQIGVVWNPEDTNGRASVGERISFATLVQRKYNIELDPAALESQGLGDLLLTEDEWTAAFARYRMRRRHLQPDGALDVDNNMNYNRRSSNNNINGSLCHSEECRLAASSGIGLPMNCPSCTAVMAKKDEDSNHSSSLRQDLQPDSMLTVGTVMQ